ncbi:hypothetical protein [Methylobacterium sp. CM6257]
MTLREEAALAAGIEAVRQMAPTAAVSIEVGDDASRLQHHAAVAALQEFAEAAHLLMVVGAHLDAHLTE